MTAVNGNSKKRGRYIFDRTEQQMNLTRSEETRKLVRGQLHGGRAREMKPKGHAARCTSVDLWRKRVRKIVYQGATYKNVCNTARNHQRAV